MRKKQKLENGREISKGVMISLLVGLLEPSVKTTMFCFDVVMLRVIRMALQPGGLPLMESSLDWMSSWNYDYTYVWWD